MWRAAQSTEDSNTSVRTRENINMLYISVVLLIRPLASNVPRNIIMLREEVSMSYISLSILAW